MNPLYPEPQNKTFIITTISSIYTIKNCYDKNHAIEKMIASFEGFNEIDILNIMKG